VPPKCEPATRRRPGSTTRCRRGHTGGGVHLHFDRAGQDADENGKVESPTDQGGQADGSAMAAGIRAGGGPISQQKADPLLDLKDLEARTLAPLQSSAAHRRIPSAGELR